MSADFDEIPVRLPSGTKAVVRLPRPFTRADATHLIHLLATYIEEKEAEAAPDTKPTEQP